MEWFLDLEVFDFQKIDGLRICDTPKLSKSVVQIYGDGQLAPWSACQEYHDTVTEQEFSQAAKMSVGMTLGRTSQKMVCQDGCEHVGILGRHQETPFL